MAVETLDGSGCNFGETTFLRVSQFGGPKVVKARHDEASFVI